MTGESGAGASSGADGPLTDQEHLAALARAYRHAEAGDALHAREGGGAEPAGYDPTLVPTPEVPDVPLHDIAHPDPADGEAKGFTTGDAQQDAILSGLEPGENGE